MSTAHKPRADPVAAPPVIGPGERVRVTFLFSVIMHAVLILGITFALEDPAASLPSLDVILVDSRTETKPEKPDFLANATHISGRVDLDADITATTQSGPTIERARPLATLELDQPVTLRAGARYLTDRVVFEIDGDLWIVPRSAESAAWRVSGMRVVDPTRLAVDLDRIPSRISLRTHGAIRTAFDVELVGGFLWATAGYAYTVGAVSGQRQSPTFGDLGGHTLALGLEATTGGFTFTAGWSRTWSTARRPDSVLALDNPFLAGDRPLPTGTYDGSIDQLGILIDAELSSPK